MDTFRITTGRNRFDREWKVTGIGWTDFVGRLRKPVVTGETMEEYQKMTKAARLSVKDVGGYVGGPMERDGERNNSSCNIRTLVTIDIDGDTRHTPDLQKVRSALDSFGCSYAIHPTHSWTPEHPRFRAVIPLDREVSADEYTPIALRVAETVGFDVTDPTTCQKARIMFWPSVSKDAPYEVTVDNLTWYTPLHADKVLASYVDWRNAAEWPGATEGAVRAQRRRHITGDLTDGRVKDPTQKEGWIGAFCRNFSIDDAIAEFSLPYTQAGHGRYTYTGGSSYGGAIVYDGGRFLYSNHATDPVSGQLCNAFDLVRIHKFGDEDRLRDPETPVNRLPSYAAMCDLCSEIDEVRATYNALIIGDVPDTMPQDGRKEQNETASSPLDLINEAMSGPDGSKPSEGADDAWKKNLDSNRKNLMATPNNFDLIFSHDPNLTDSLQMDEFAGRRMVKRAMPWDKKGEEFPREYTDGDAAELALYFSRFWKIHGGRDALNAVVDVQMNRDRVHPVRDWLNGLPEWDGVERADTVLIRYLGSRDCALNRAITRKHLVAAVKRVFQPGCKYDQVLILIGLEGTGKSSIIQHLAVRWYMDSNIPVGDKDAYQNLTGNWLIEMSELADYETKSTAAYKNFISSQTDRYRPAYGRETVTVPRQCVFFGTTNDEGFLKGRTGNRRFWVMDCPGSAENLPHIFDGTLDAEIPQIWAEVLHYYRAGERLTLDTALSAQMRSVQQGHEGILRDDNVEIIREFVLMPKPGGWESMSIEERRNWYRGRMTVGEVWPAGPQPAVFIHEYICVKEISMVVLDQRLTAKSRYEDDNLYYICDHLSCLEKEEGTKRFGKELGKQRYYKVIREDGGTD